MGGWLSAHLLRKAERQQGSPSVRLEPRAESPTVLGEASGLLRRPPPDLARPTHVISILSLLRVT